MEERILDKICYNCEHWSVDTLQSTILLLGFCDLKDPCNKCYSELLTYSDDFCDFFESKDINNERYKRR